MYAVPPKRLKQKERSKARFGKYATIGLGLFGLFCFVNVWQNVSITQQTRKNDRLRHRLKTLQRSNAMLMLKVEKLKEVDVLLEVTEDKLDVVPAPTLNLKLEANP